MQQELLAASIRSNFWLALQDQRIRQELGQSQPVASEYLKKQAELVGRRGQGETPEKLLETLRAGNLGLNRDVIEKLAILRQTDVQTREEELRKVILFGQTAEQREKENRKERIS